MQLDLGNNIRQFRRRDKRTQEALAEALGVTSQAVSRWESGGSYPDMNLIPSIANYFGVSIDELFGYNAWENERLVNEICRKAAAMIVDDAPGAETLLREGLVQFPGNEKLLTVLVYALWALPGREDDLIEQCKVLSNCATDDGVKVDVLRLLATAYRRQGKQEMVSSVIAQIPEFHFTKVECVAKLADGKESLDAAQFQMNRSGQCLVEMLQIMKDRYNEIGDADKAVLCHKLSIGVVELFRKEGAHILSAPDCHWLD